MDQAIDALVNEMVERFFGDWIRSPEGRLELRAWMHRNDKFRAFQSRRFNEVVRTALAEAAGRRI